MLGNVYSVLCSLSTSFTYILIAICINMGGLIDDVNQIMVVIIEVKGVLKGERRAKKINQMDLIS